MIQPANAPLLRYKKEGSGPVIVFLHGMAGSHRYWSGYSEQLAATHTVVSVDLLGFGHSPKPSIDYTADAHIASITATLDSLGITKFVLVGHSMGALLALRLANLHASRVKKLLLISIPLYTSAAQAKQRITLDRRRRKFAYYGPSSRVLCTAWCTILRPISRRVAKHYIRNKPIHVAEDSVLHTWHSYSSSLFHVIEHQDVVAEIKRLPVTPIILYGDREDEVVLKNARNLLEKKCHLTMTLLSGGHNLPLEQQSAIIDRWLA